jgi:hypothetical protein
MLRSSSLKWTRIVRTFGVFIHHVFVTLPIIFCSFPDMDIGIRTYVHGKIFFSFDSLKPNLNVATNVSITIHCRNRMSPTEGSEKLDEDRQAAII